MKEFDNEYEENRKDIDGSEESKHGLISEKLEEDKEGKTQDSKEKVINKKSYDKRSKKRMIAWALIFAIIGGLIGGSFSWILLSKQLDKDQTSEVQTINIESDGKVGAIEAVAAKTMPSVVGITANATQDTIFGPVAVEGSGSGFIVSKDGYIVSNAHVVGQEGDTVHVLLNDGSQADGQVVWSDSSLDLGLVKIDKNNLPVMELGDSEKLNIGETAIAIGNPLGLDFQRTVTSGVISGLNRNIGQVEGNYMDGLIQTDASINNGNSGGPLLNSKGEVIGINTVKISTAEGLGFSIPINTVTPIIEQVIKTGDYKTVSLGISGYSISELESRYKKDFGTEGKGVVVVQVEADSPAAKGDLNTYDIITQLGETEIQDMNQLRKELYKYKVGDKVKLTLIRQGKKMDKEITFTDYQVPEQEDPSSIIPYSGQ